MVDCIKRIQARQLKNHVNSERSLEVPWFESIPYVFLFFPPAKLLNYARGTAIAPTKQWNTYIDDVVFLGSIDYA